MMRSMFSGVSGLKVHQTKMDVIGNNIANVNTVGYKSQRVTFSDVFSQTISASSSANDETGRGGVNAMQVGLGVNVSSIDMLMTQGAAQRTDNPFDLMINGEGFIVVEDTSGKYFTRAGALRLDDAGNLVISNGMKVQGWPATYNEETNQYVINSQEVQDVNLSDSTIKSSPPMATTKAQLSGNINSTDQSATTNISFYDSQGNYYSMVLSLEKSFEMVDKKDAAGNVIMDTTVTPPVPIQEKVYKPNEWDLKPATNAKGEYVVKDAKGNELVISAEQLKFSVSTAKSTDQSTDVGVDVGIHLKFNDAGELISPPQNENDEQFFKIGFGGDSKLDAIMDATQTTFSSITVDIKGLTQYVTKTNIDPKTSNGNAAGTLAGYSIGSDGIITATYSNGDMRKIAQIPLAQFDNPAGLEKVGDNVYAMTTNSGQFDGIGSEGVFNTGVLEMSNVDLSSEFTDMIVTQRGFQANSKIISVSDEMLQELTNLKR